MIIPMICPKCGATMNRHADKLVRPHRSDEALDPTLGGVIMEMHQCPACGAEASRIAK